MTEIIMGSEHIEKKDIWRGGQDRLRLDFCHFKVDIVTVVSDGWAKFSDIGR
jgi:hypothetical protein